MSLKKTYRTTKQKFDAFWHRKVSKDEAYVLVAKLTVSTLLAVFLIQLLVRSFVYGWGA